jgi:hypothetical protein
MISRCDARGGGMNEMRPRGFAEFTYKIHVNGPHLTGNAINIDLPMKR